MGTASAWTPERRAKQAEIIRRIKPWENSTGPRTDEGKAASSQNARSLTEADLWMRAALRRNRIILRSLGRRTRAQAAAARA